MSVPGNKMSRRAGELEEKDVAWRGGGIGVGRGMSLES
jgi:hypothetical protein